ncbi:MAG: hypothetical protein KY466_07070 [Gemmatimonadetes bacterium]|nr:hypothetical protein [Gemmatimonadota bacterium]
MAPFLLGWVAACQPATPAGDPGDPLPGLTTVEAERFVEGRALFDRVFSAAEGLGPLFNENQCSACHTDPASGGTGEQLVIKATRFEPPLTCHLLAEEGGENLRRRVTPALASHGFTAEPVPAGATERARFTTPFLFGAGLVEAIPDAAILRNADPDDADADGISGRPGRTVDGRLGRFSRKAEVATLLDFTDSALRFEMGLSTALTPVEPVPPHLADLPDIDPAPEPEVGREEMDLITDFVRFLAPLRPRSPEDPAARATVRRGEGLFHQVGCDRCHTPSFRTGRSDVEALDRKRIEVYSDLLLHDMGEGLASVCGLAATPTELRTQPLAGLGHRRIFLHDGRALNPRDAILAHDGEARGVRDAFAALPRTTQEDLLRFLDTL